MLLNYFYFVLELKPTERDIKASIKFDRDHPIFKGHFPAVPVVPGVCMVQIVRELTEEVYQKKLSIVTGDNIKFLSVINPTEVEIVNVDIQHKLIGDDIDINASISAGEITYFKFKGTFRIS